MKYIESIKLPNGRYDHTEVKIASDRGYPVEFESIKDPETWQNNGEHPIKHWFDNFPYRALVPDYYMTKAEQDDFLESASAAVDRMESGYDLLHLIQDKFKSGNDIPVERITITRAEIDAISKRIIP